MCYVMFEDNVLLNKSFDGSYDKVDVDVTVVCVLAGLFYIV